jgi:chemotaxis signal transduction protein
MVVNAVTEVSRIPSSSIEPPSTVITTNDSEYPTGIVKVISDEAQVELTDVSQSADAASA